MPNGEVRGAGEPHHPLSPYHLRFHLPSQQLSILTTSSQPRHPSYSIRALPHHSTHPAMPYFDFDPLCGDKIRLCGSISRYSLRYIKGIVDREASAGASYISCCIVYFVPISPMRTYFDISIHLYRMFAVEATTSILNLQ